eukprot:8033215-Pyramimonas_sp.AAC.1
MQFRRPPQRASTAMPGRDRNKVKFATRTIRLTSEVAQRAAARKKPKDAATETKARIPGGRSAILQ